MNAIFSLGGSILFTFIMKKFGRRSLFLFFEGLSLLIPAAIIVLSHFEVFSVTEWLKIILIMIFQMMVNFKNFMDFLFQTFRIIYFFKINNLFCYFPELLPSTNRVAGMGLINFFAACGCMVAPFIVMVKIIIKNICFTFPKIL